MAENTKKPKKKVTFHNKLSASFREIHVDGAFGGITPSGYINLNFYAERFPIPKSTEYSLKDDNTINEKINDSEDSKDGIIREYEFGIYCDLKTAVNIKKFLDERISVLQSTIQDNADIGQ